MDFEDYVPLTAAAVGGHGRADWGNWANRQLRDQNGDDAGEWIEMGRGSRLRYKKSDGSIGTATATYVGFSDKPNHGRFYVTGVDGVQEGVYDLDAGSVDPVKFYFAEGTKVGDYLENYYKSIGRNLDDIDANSKLPVIDFSALTPSQLTQEEADEIKTENRMPPPRNIDEELKSRTESAKTASELKEGDIVFDEALKRYGSIEFVEPSPDGSGNVDAVVRWSNNQVQELNNLPADQEIKVWPQEQKEDEGPIVDAKKKPATKLAEDIEVGDRIVRDGKNYTILSTKQLRLGYQFTAKPDDGGPDEKFSLKDEDKVQIASEAQEEQPAEQAPSTPAAQAPVVEQAKTKPASKLKKGDQIVSGGETYTVVSTTKSEDNPEDVVVTVTSESTGEAQIELEFSKDEAIDLVQPKAPEAVAEPADVEKQKYEDALANGAQRSPVSFNYGDVIKSPKGDEYIFISSKPDKDANGRSVIAATLQDPLGNKVLLNFDPNKKYPVLVQKSKKADEKNPYKLENVYRKPNVERKSNQGEPEEGEEESSQPATTTDGQKAIEDLKVNDIVVIDGKTYRFVAADENEDGTVQLVLKDSKGKEFIPEVDYKYEDIVQTAAKMGSKSKAKAKAAAEPTIAVPGAKGLPGSKGTFIKTEGGKFRVGYKVIGGGRVLLLTGYPGISGSSLALMRVRNALANLSTVNGKFTPPFFYNGDGTKKAPNGEGTVEFLSKEEKDKGWVLNLNPGETEIPAILIENLINAIQQEFDSQPIVQEQRAPEDGPPSGETNTTGMLSDSPRVTYTIQSDGKISLVGAVPGGYEELRNHLFDIYPEENVILDSDSEEIEIFAQSGQDINALRSEVLAAVKKYVAGDSAEEEKPVAEPIVEEEETESESDQVINNRISELLKIASDHLAKGEYKEAFEAYMKASNLYHYEFEDDSDEVENTEEEEEAKLEETRKNKAEFEKKAEEGDDNALSRLYDLAEADKLEETRKNKAEFEKKAEEGDEDAAFNLWDIAIEDDDKEAAEKWARKLSEIAPYSLVYRTMLADALVDLGRLDEAESIYRDVIEEDKDLIGTVDEDGDEYIETDAINGLARLLASKGLYEEAARLLAKDFEEWDEEEKPEEEPVVEEEAVEEEAVEEDRQKTYDIMQAAFEFYAKQMSAKDNKGIKYLQDRGYSQESIEQLGIVFAGDSKFSLSAHLTSLGFTVDEILATGLVNRFEDRLLDSFSNRVLFPFKDSKGRVVGFNGRDITGKSGGIKYILTAGPNETNKSVFNKSEVLYNLENTIDAVKETGQLIVVEGQMDVLAYREAGINNVVAISGTSISPKQIELLQDTFGDDLKEIILSLDADEPGKKATKGVYQTLADSGYNYEISTVSIPQGFKDPGELFEDKTQGTDSLKYLIKERRDASIPEEDLATDQQFQEYARLIDKYKNEMSEDEYRYWLNEFDRNATKKDADSIIKALSEQYEIPKLQAELDSLVEKAIKTKAISPDYKYELDYDIKTSSNKKEAIQQAIESLKKKIEASTPAVAKAQITQAQRDSINRRFSSGAVTQQQIDALVAILEKPDLTKEEIERVIRTLDLAENIWRMDNGWTLDDRRGVVMTPPIIDLGVTPMQVVQRIKTYKPTKDINGNPLSESGSDGTGTSATPKPEFFDPADNILTPEKNNNAYWKWAENAVKNGTISPEDLTELKDRIRNAAITSRTSAQGTDINGNRTRLNILKSNVLDYIKNNPEATLEKVLSYLEKILSLDENLAKWANLLQDSDLRKEIESQVDGLIKQYYNEAKSTPTDQSGSESTEDPVKALRSELENLIYGLVSKFVPLNGYDSSERNGETKKLMYKIPQKADANTLKNIINTLKTNDINSLKDVQSAFFKGLSSRTSEPAAEPATAPKPSNLGAQTGTPSLPQTMDNFKADGSPAYAPKGGAIRGAKLQAGVSEAYRRGGTQGVQDFLNNSNVVPVDIESTGMSSYDGQLKPGNRIIQLGASKKGANGEQIFFNQFIRQEDDVVMSEWSAENLQRPVLDADGNPTGEYVKIDKEWLDQQKSEKEVLEEFIKFLGADGILLAHNANFDISVLEEALDRNGLSIDVLGAIDTLDFVNIALPKYNADDSKGNPVELDAPKRKRDDMNAEDVDPNNPMHFQASAKLNDVLKFFGLEPTGWHRADADAYDASRILDNILNWLIKNPDRESTNRLGHGFLDFDKIAQQADKDLISYLKAIGSGTPATDKQKSLNPKAGRGKSPEGFAPDLRTLGVSEDKIKEVIAPVQNMTRGQAEEYIASILSDVRSGKEPDINKALEKSKSKFAPTRSSNTIPNSTPQGGGLREFEVSKRAKDLSIGDKIRSSDSDVYGTIKSIDKQTAGFVKIFVEYEDGSSETLNAKVNTLVAVYEKEKPSEAAINDSDEQPGQATPATSTETPQEAPTSTSTPAPTPVAVPDQGERTPEAEVQEVGYQGLTIDLSDYPAADRDRIRKTFEQINELKKLNGTGLPIKIVESGKPVTDKETIPEFLSILTSKEEMFDIMKYIGLSDFKAKRLAKKLENLKGKPNYFEELDKINEELEKHKRNFKSFKDVEKDRGFRDYLVARGLIPKVSESFEFILSDDPKIAAIRSRERDIYYAWSQSLKKRGKTKTIKDGNISLTYSKDEAEEAKRLLEATKKIQETLPLDGRKLKVSVYSPEQLDLLNLGTIVGAAIVTDKLAHIAISSNTVGKQESDSREGGKAGTIDSDTFTIAHEYGHVFDEIAMDGQAREDFASQFGNAQLTEYGRENLSENFAEYIMDLAYSALKGEEPVSKEFKEFIEKAIEDGRIDPKKLKKSGPFFGEDGIKPRKIVAKVGGQDIPDLLEKTEEERKQFEATTETNNGGWGAWLRETDESAGYLPNLSDNKVALKYAPQVLGISEDDIDALSEEEKQQVSEVIRKRLGPVVEAQKRDSRTYRVFEVAGTNIHIRTKDGSVSPETLASVVNELKELNRFNDMGGMPVIVTIAESNTFSIANQFIDGEYQGFNVLNKDGTQMHIVLNAAQNDGKSGYKAKAEDKYQGPAPETEMLNTLIHEYLGHGLAKVFLGQDINGRGNHHERFKEFVSKFPLYSRDNLHPVSVYGNESVTESFAEFVRAGYLLMRNGQTTDGYPEIKRFLQYLDPLVTTLDPLLRTNKDGSNLANVDKMESASPKFPKSVKANDANAELYIYGRRSTFYSNGLDPYGRPVDPEFDETLFLAYTMAEGASSFYMKNPNSDNFIRYAAYASVVNDLYNAKFFSYPKNNPRQTVDTVLENIVTSEDSGSFRRWQSDKPFVPLRYQFGDSKFNNDFVAGTYTDADGNTYQIVYVSSKPANPSDDVSESAYVFVSKPNQTLGDFVDFDSTLNDLIKNSAGQLKIRNHKSGGMLDRDELEIQGTKVDSAHRRRGLATAMLAFAKQNSAKYLRFSKEQTIQEDAWARSVDQNPKNHLGLPAFTNSESGLNPSNVSPIADANLLVGQSSQSSEERTRINFNPNNRNAIEEDLFAQVASEYLSNPVFTGARDYSSSTGGGLGPNNSVVGAVSVDVLSSIAGNEVDETRVQELIEKINANKGFSDPVVVYYNPKTGQSVVADGNHHVEAAKRIGLTHIPARVIAGEFESSEYLSPKMVGKEWSWSNVPFSSREWPLHVNPYFVFNNSDLVSSLEDTPIVDPLRDRVVLKSGVEGISPDMDDISKLMGKLVKDNVTGQIYQVLDEYVDKDGNATGQVVVVRFVGIADDPNLGLAKETMLIDGKFNFDASGKIYLSRGGASINDEDPYNDFRQYEAELRSLDDLEDVTESFVKSGGQSLIIAESMFFAWTKNDKKGRISKFVSPGVVELAVLTGLDKDGDKQFDFYNVPVSDLVPIQNQRETLGSEPAYLSDDMRPNPATVTKIQSLLNSLYTKGFLSTEFFTSMATAIQGRFQTASGVEDMYNSLLKISQRRRNILEKSGKLKQMVLTRNVRVQSGPAPESTDSTPKPTSAPAPAAPATPVAPIVKGRMSFRQLYEENKKQGDVPSVDRKIEGPTPIPDSQNPVSKPEIEAVREVLDILSEISGYDESYVSKQEEDAILDSLAMATSGTVSDYLNILRARRLKKRMQKGEPVSGINLPRDLKQETIDIVENYTPKVNLDGSAYEEKTTIIDDDEETRDLISFIDAGLLPGSLLLVTGGAGTGKSTVLRRMISELGPRKNIIVVASTGTAAQNVGDGLASTIHSVFRINPNTITAEGFTVPDPENPGESIGTLDLFIRDLKKDGKRLKLFRDLDTLAIDEISMVDANIMELIDLSLRTARGNQKPFGGVKVVAFGDDNQLPPVEAWSTGKEAALLAELDEIDAFSFADKSQEETEAKKLLKIKAAKFDRDKHNYMLAEYGGYRWYKSNVIGVSNPLAYMLTKNRRQEKDKKYADTLKKIPLTQVTASELAYFNESNVEVPQEILDMGIIRLVLTNARAESINEAEVTKLERSGALGIEFEGKFTGEGKAAFNKKDLHAPEKIKYYVGEKVIFIQNDTIDLRREAGYGGKTNRWTNGTQGTVVDFDENDGLPLVEIVAQDGTKTVVKVGYGKSIASGAVVSTQLDPITGRVSEKSDIGVLAEYTQIPMLPAYAMTIHKSQGRSIDRAIVDLQKDDGTDDKAFAPGQLYVALSRLISKNGLFLTRELDYKDFMVDEDNERFYETLVKMTEESLKAEAEAAKSSESPSVDKKVDSSDKILLSNVTKADVKEAKKILEHKARPIPNLPSDWGTRDLSDHFFSEFGYGEKDSFDRNLDAIMSEKVENLHLEQKLLVSLIVAHGKADIYEHAESGTTIKRHLEDGIFSNKDASDNEVIRAANAHKRILDSGYVIDGGRMDINLRDLSYIKKNASGMYSASKDEINLDRNRIYGWDIQGKKSRMSEDEEFAYVLAHEYGHALDNKFAENGERLSEVLENLIKSGMQNRAKEILRKYGLSNAQEYFAESYAGLVLQSVLEQLGYPKEAFMDETLIDEIKNQINLRNSQ